MIDLLIIFVTACLTGLGFWYYNRRQINSLTESLNELEQDKTIVIASLQNHIMNNENKKPRTTKRPAKKPTVKKTVTKKPSIRTKKNA